MPQDDLGSYVTKEQFAEVHGTITEEQFREMHRLAGNGHERDRFKGWSTSYIVVVPTDRVLAPLLAYLRQEGLRHSFTVDREWRPRQGA